MYAWATHTYLLISKWLKWNNSCTNWDNYQPQRSWAKVIFSQVCVKNSVHRGGGCLPQCMLGYTPAGRGRPPREQTPLGPGRQPPQTRQSPPGQGRHPQTRQTTPLTRQTPREADSSIRSTSSWYASYWNAFLFDFVSEFMICRDISLHTPNHLSMPLDPPSEICHLQLKLACVWTASTLLRQPFAIEISMFSMYMLSATF